MKKDWWLAIGVTVLTVVLALGLIRLFAPQLLGGARDLQLVQVSKAVPPFFENVFRAEDYASREFILQDPYVRRAKPLFPDQFVMGPHDILGFRNRAIPHLADIVTLGDSQTYGNNALLAGNWPNRMQAALGSGQITVYNMAVGAWGAAEYWAMFDKALLFQPQMIIVAFYTGNDALGTFQQAYGNERYGFLKADRTLTSADLPKVVFPAPESEWWRVSFKDGVSTIFTPKLRHASNQPVPAVKAGYAGMAEAGRLMGKMAQDHQVKLVFTIIPTKELVYAKKIALEGIDPPADYLALITDERAYVEALAAELRQVPEAIFVDVVAPLQEAAQQASPLYPADADGHPVEAGYAVIGGTLATTVRPLLSVLPEGLVALHQNEKNYLVFLIRDDHAWLVPAPDIAERNGWSLENIPLTEERLIRRLPLAGYMDRVDAAQFGPR
ncbi:MAG: SGNH/GDSL hydrolase family protein [Gammaproteobacteria bacterium]|nr:SGNH/GDSL hydrolase family protein [Gammaproteobacteria bacterium]